LVPDQNRRDYGEKTDDQGKKREKKNHGFALVVSSGDEPNRLTV
jgi:hypothetical protein